MKSEEEPDYNIINYNKAWSTYNMRIIVSESFKCPPYDVLNLKTSEVLYHLCYIIEKNKFEKYITEKTKTNNNVKKFN